MASGGPFAVLLTIWAILWVGPAAAAPVQSFDAFVSGFAKTAAAAGIDPGLYTAVTRGLTTDPRMPSLVVKQPEFSTPIWDYLDKRVSQSRIARGRRVFAANTTLFARIGQRYGVDPYLLAAIWGLETDYGAILGNANFIRPVLRSLFTLSWQRRGRVAADRAELIAALKLIQNDHWTADTLVGSWAGAIGHTQVIVSGLLAHGQDGDGDGRIDPHRSLADALATSAAYLKALGYQSGVDWGFEVRLPKGFDYSLADRTQLRPIRFFAERGVRRVAGRRFADPDLEVFLYVPAGRSGPKFLMTGNYLVLKGYNFSDSYALSVAFLTDRLKGAGPLVGAWPRQTRFPDLAQRQAIQRDLKTLGYYAGDVDGRIGPITQSAYQRFQAAKGLVADGFVTLDAYRRLQAATR